MTQVKSPLVVTIRLLQQSCSSFTTVASLASARPKWRISESTNSSDSKAIPNCSIESANFMKTGREDALYQYSRAAFKDHPQLENVMGSFSSIPILTPCDDQDEDLDFPKTGEEHLLARCQAELHGLPEPFKRNVKIDCPIESKTKCSDHSVRILQWNVLSQALGTQVDIFVMCNPLAMNWSTRRWRIVEEIIRHDPDIICLQEVDHFKMLSRALGSIGYRGRFLPKPDSPCLYLDANTGPDGCAIFYKAAVFDLVSKSSKILEVWGEESNQVVLSLNLRHKESRREICVATTHLKARSGDHLSTIRNEQGKDILQFLQKIHKEAPIILTGDFNDEPSEAVYKTLTENERTPLVSAYKLGEACQTDGEQNMEDVTLEYTTWKIRETGEQKHILDYIFHSPELETVSTLDMPTDQQVGEDRLPSLQFASDHLSLVADIKIF